MYLSSIWVVSSSHRIEKSHEPLRGSGQRTKSSFRFRMNTNYIISVVVFEFEPVKSQANKAKHGIDFVEAQELWKYRAVIVRSDRGNERRFARIR
jgi:hypothetical protein